MDEKYIINHVNGTVQFQPYSEMPAWIDKISFNLEGMPEGINLHSRMGDPQFLHCLALQINDKPGGYFVMYNKLEAIFASYAPSNLIFAIGQNYFAQMAANVRYAVDVFENMGIAYD